uniref:Uncharacterized protein n=1 Tax=Oryza brachyantha TaxID=4533 RepID=J3NE40_ORYBR
MTHISVNCTKTCSAINSKVPMDYTCKEKEAICAGQKFPVCIFEKCGSHFLIF